MKNLMNLPKKFCESRPGAGVNFTNILLKAFTHADPKSTKRHSIHQCLFVLLESAYKKVAIKMLVKLRPARVVSRRMS